MNKIVIETTANWNNSKFIIFLYHALRLPQIAAIAAFGLDVGSVECVGEADAKQ